jgi:asparagine synthase (glutamine-hydrolysing)
MISDVPLGAFLSGGIDSTAIVSLMTELSTTRVRTFTIGFHVPGFDESVHADTVARHLGTDHTAEYLTERNVLDIIAQVPAMYGEPFADASALPTHLLSITARRQVTVSLSGDGGDEAFGGYTRYDHLVLGHRLSRMAGPIGALMKPMVARFPGKVGRGAALLGLPPKDIYQRLVRLVDPEDVRALTGRLPGLEEFDRAWASSGGRTVQQRAMLADLLTYLPEAILVKVDRAAMRTSLETRAPLLDHRVLEFALRLPPELLRRKHLLKQLVYRRVPRKLVDRPKMGFGVPLARWFRGELRPLLLDVLTPARMHAAGVQDYGVIQRMLDQHMSDAAGHGPRLWALLVLGLWYDGRRGRRQTRQTETAQVVSRSLSVAQ